MTITTEERIDLRGVVELIRLRADEIDRDGRLTDDVITALRATGIYRSLLPAVLGGFERPPHGPGLDTRESR